jgi:subtilisin family serine protease
VKDARASGILWVNSAGNRAQRHWSGLFVDTDLDGFLNFTPIDEGITYSVGSGVQLCLYLKWDDWPFSDQDYQLRLQTSPGGAVVASSLVVQNGSQPPRETLCYTNGGPGQNFAATIQRVAGIDPVRLDLFSVNGTMQEYRTPAGSVTEPGSAPEALAVGAICWQNDALESFSSQGPTIDLRTKPDITAPDGVSNATFGASTGCGSGFSGTSASSPAVAGAAALVKQANPSFSPAQLQAFLEGRALDLGLPGKDNQFGSGKLSLGAPPPCPTPRPDLPRSLAPVSAGRVQATVGTGHGGLTSITAIRLTNARVELPGGTLTASGQVLPLNVLSTTFFVQRTGTSGPYTAELSFSDGCGAYPLFFGAGS